MTDFPPVLCMKLLSGQRAASCPRRAACRCLSASLRQRCQDTRRYGAARAGSNLTVIRTGFCIYYTGLRFLVKNRITESYVNLSNKSALPHASHRAGLCVQPSRMFLLVFLAFEHNTVISQKSSSSLPLSTPLTFVR